MPETISKKSKTATGVSSKTVKATPPAPTKQVQVFTKKPTDVVEKKTKTNTKYSVLSETKIKKILDEERINKETIETIKKIKEIIENKKEVKNVLNEDQLEIVRSYITKHKKRLENESNKGVSTNEIALRSFMEQKYKFKKDFSFYLAVLCDLIAEEIISSSMKHVSTINKTMIKKTHIVDSELSSKLLYPLYCKLPSYIELTTTDKVIIEEQSEQQGPDTTNLDNNFVQPVIELNLSGKWFSGNIRKLFNNLQDNDKKFKLEKKYQTFISTLLVEFLDRLISPLLSIVHNNSRNRVIVQNTLLTVIEIFMSDFNLSESSRFQELNTVVQKRLNNC